MCKILCYFFIFFLHPVKHYSQTLTDSIFFKEHFYNEWKQIRHDHLPCDTFYYSDGPNPEAFIVFASWFKQYGFLQNLNSPSKKVFKTIISQYDRERLIHFLDSAAFDLWDNHAFHASRKIPYATIDSLVKRHKTLSIEDALCHTIHTFSKPFFLNDSICVIFSEESNIFGKSGEFSLYRRKAHNIWDFEYRLYAYDQTSFGPLLEAFPIVETN